MRIGEGTWLKAMIAFYFLIIIASAYGGFRLYRSGNKAVGSILFAFGALNIAYQVGQFVNNRLFAPTGKAVL